MTTTVQNLLDQISTLVQENASAYGGLDWSTGLWSVDELIGYINAGCKQFVLDSQLIKIMAVVASVTGQRIYGNPSNAMQIDRIAFSNKALYRTNRTMLDRENPKWRTLSGIPKQYHQDQLPTRQFETDRAPTSTMTGTGYSAFGSISGVLTFMSGSDGPYTATLPAGGRGVLRYTLGTPAINGILQDSPLAGTLRQMFSGVTNFSVLATRIMADVVYPTDLLTVPDFCVLYIKMWVLQHMLEKEGEGQDLPVAKYCGARYMMGVKLFRRLVSAMNDSVVPPQAVPQ